MWMMHFHLHVYQNSDYDDQERTGLFFVNSLKLNFEKQIQ